MAVSNSKSNRIIPTFGRRGPWLFVCHLLVAVGLAVSAGTPRAVRAAQDSPPLEPGRPVERELSTGQSHSYEITLASGQYLQLAFGQRGIDVAAALFAPDGRKLRQADRTHALGGSEAILLVADAAGSYRVEVSSSSKLAANGSYEIRIEALRTPTAGDRDRAAADSTYREAVQLRTGVLADKRKGIEKYQEALRLYRSAGDRLGEADALNSLGGAYYLLGEMRKALESCNEALPVFRAIGDRTGEAATLQNIGAIHWLLGDRQQALERYREALPLTRAVADREGEGVTLNNLGMAYSSVGETQKALDLFNEALPIRRAVGDRDGESTTLNNIAGIYRSLGDLQKALDRYQEALAISRAISDRQGETVVLNNIGGVYRLSGELQKALDQYRVVLPIFREIGDRRGEATALHNLGGVYSSLGEVPKAIEMYQEALRIARALGERSGEATALQNLGGAYRSLGETPAALDRYQESLQIARSIGDRRGEAGTLLGIAQIEQARGNLVPARQTLEQALAIIESLRANIESQELRASYFASQQELYQCYIDVLMQLHRRNPAAAIDVEALAVSERARARSLLELLAESRADIRQGVDPALLSRERLLQQQLNAKAAAQLRLLNRPHTSAQAEAAAKELASVAAEYDELQTRIHAASPGYAALTRPAPLTLKELQTRVLDGDTLLLEYALGRERSYLWAVTSSSVTGYELPKRAVIEAAARRVYELFSSGQDFADEVQTAAAALSGMLLGPVASRLGNRRLLIVADGALQYLPFGALPVPHSGSSGERSGRAAEVPMIVNHEIVSLPSASTLAVLRREQAVRPEVSGVAVVADPVFDRNDPRVKLETAEPTIARLQSAELSTRRLERSVRESGVLSFGRLRSTRREAEEIVALAGEGESLKALDFDASRATVLSGQLSRFRVVHFATHGLLNSQHPHLSGIVLSLVDEQGQPQEGFLLAHEVYNLKLGAELVVLSGCQTALGKEIKGEGLVGLTRGFMYAGAPRVIASLWRVPDRETAELMRRFYQGLLKERLRPAAALRAAQIEMWKEKRLAAPYNWAAFVLQGEWK